MDPNRLRELLEAFPPGMPGGNDRGLDMADALAVREAAAADPRIAAELARVQAWDASLMRAMEDVPVPAGLAERLIGAVKAQEAADMVTPAAVAKTVAEKPAERRGVPRRTWLMSLTAAAAVIAVAVLGGSYAWLLRGPSGAAVVEEARKLWAVQIDAPWQNAFSVASLEDYPPSGRLTAGIAAWRRVDTALDHNAVAYKLALGNGRRAMLLVMRSSRAVSGLLGRPPREPESSTQAVCIGAWQEGELVYVLILEGSQQEYERLLQDAPLT